ncbi:MAG: InlB B-repeat-containing protein, partial [Clostridia bacterium]|nr:InlB B-repeat-containing protein [Clostridia bacterium]
KLTYDVEENITANAFEKTANVTYDYKGGAGDKTGETVTLGFANWAANSDGSGDTYTDGQPVKNLASEKDATVNLYAQWNGVNVTLPAASRTGYDFAGWYAGDEKIEGDTYTVTGAVTLTAHWTAHTYTVAFDGNRGAGATPVTGETASVSFTYDGKANILTANGFARAGYDFLGWALDPAAAAPTYTDGQTVTDNLTADDGASVTLYAVWSALTQTNNYSGATVGGASTFTGATDSTVVLGSPDAKTGYTFGGWYGNAELTGEPVTSVLIPAGGATVYAKWTANEYTVTFVSAAEAPGYTTEGTTSATATYDAAMPEITLPVRAGYSFGGFKIEGGELYYNADGSSARVYDIPGDANLYAVWTADEDTAYTVKHYKQDLGADTYTLADTDELTGTSDTTVTAEVRSYTGFTAPAEQTVFIKPDGSAVLEYRYARNSYTLTVVPAGDSFEGETTVTKQFEDSYTITATPLKTGYGFDSWSKTAGEGSLDGSTFTFGAGDGTVTAVYTPNNYTVRFNSNNGDGLTSEQILTYDAPEALDANTFSKDVEVSFDYNGGFGSPESVILDAFTFTGWNTAPDGSGDGYGDGAEVVNLSTGADVELYAQWTTTTIDMPETSRTGYDLDGWYEGENKVEGAYTVTGDVSFEARWTAHTYTVAFDGNQGAGATPVTGSTASADFTYDAANALAANGFERAGYDFLGWSTDPAATAADYTDSQTVSDGLYAGKGATVTLYAVWQALEQTNSYEGATSDGAAVFTGATDSTVTLGEPDAKTGYTFGGWYRNAELTDGPVTEITVPAGGARVYAKWTANRYAVTLGVGDEGLAYITPGTTDVTATYDADMPAITAPSRVGYQFAGYYTDDGVMYYDADGNSARTWDIDGEAALTARWIPDGDTKYKVEHYLEDLNADTYTLETYGIFGGESDADVTPAVGSFTGFTAPAAQTVRIEPDGSTVVKYYYTRNSYTVKFLNYDGALLSEKVYEYGDTVAEPAAPTKPSDSANHYFFSRWDPAVVTVDGDITYKAEFTAHAHEWKSEVTVRPDGKNRGVRTYTCEDCGSSYREVIKSQFEDCPWCGKDHSGHGWIGEINWIFHMIFAMIRDIFNFASRG